MKSDSKILVCGASGMVGSAIIRRLKKLGYNNLLTPTHRELDYTDQSKVLNYFKTLSPEYVFLAAAKVGGIMANNKYRADFIYENLMITSNVINAAHVFDAKKLIFFGSSCIYPKECAQPIKENYLLTSSLEWTNEPYAVAKIAGIKLCENIKIQYGKNFFSVMSASLYGENDSFDEENSHVIPGLIQKMVKAKKNNDQEFFAWGTGRPRREFLYVDDLAEASVFLMNSDVNIPSLINVGTGIDITISELTKLIAQKLNYTGQIKFNETYPDGTMRKLLDVSTINKLGWKFSTSLSEGLDKEISYYFHKLSEIDTPKIQSALGLGI